MVVLIDTNVVIDFCAHRDPFFREAEIIMQKCVNGEITGCIAAHSITNSFYILRKEYSPEERKIMLLDLCHSMNIIGIDQEKIIYSLVDDCFDDVEDCLQAECAASISADYIVTRNTGDFTGSAVPAIMPDVFLELVAQET